MKKAFFINGGAGRVLCSFPALVHYKQNIDPEVIIVAESWMDLFMASPELRDNVYPIGHKGLFQDKLKDREIYTPEPYRLNSYFNQKVNLIQAFDILINGCEDIPETKTINLSINKVDQLAGYQLVQQVKQQFGKEKTLVFQPFGSAIQNENGFMYDTSGRSFEVKDVFNLVEELSKDYNIIMFTDQQIPTDKPMGAAIPQMNMLQWMGIIQACDYFLGCDSMGQHYAHALGKPATVVIGSTWPENISYPSNKDFDIIDNGIGKRIYAPYRITHDFVSERQNEDLMTLDSKMFKKIIKSVQDRIK